MAKNSSKKISVKFIISIVLIALGVLLILKPELISSLIVLIIGLAFIIYGVVQILLFISRRHKENAMSGKALVLPIIAVAVGVLLICRRDATTEFLLPLVTGAWMVVDAIMGFVNVSAIKKVGGKRRLALICALIALVTGVIMIIIALTRTFGSNHMIDIIVGLVYAVYGVASIIGQTQSPEKAVKAASRVK